MFDYLVVAYFFGPPCMVCDHMMVLTR